MKTIFEAANPRPDVLSGELRDEIFAAQLEEVVAGRADRVYQDPTDFFANTYPTSGLKTLLTEALGRIAGKSAAPIIRLETAFGGGKTHSLIALYHLAANQARPIGVETYVEPDLLPDEPVRVAVAVGNALDPAQGVDHGDTTTHTLWGELAYQLGTFEHVARADADRTAPGTGSLAKVFAGGPVIVMLDEVARYLEVADAVPVGNSTLADQTTAFLMALLEYAASVDHVVAVYTLASSSDAFADQTERLIEKIDALKGSEAVSSRHEHVITPTGENEIAAIVRHRLFEQVDKAAAKDIAAGYHSALVEQIDGNADLPSYAGQAGYAKDIESSYPFHPELLTALNEKVSTIPNFQKTRGALRLLARVVRELWANRPEDTYLIHPHHINLSLDDVANDLTSRLNRPVFKQVIEADIVNPMAGAKAHAALVDEQLTSTGKPALATRMASTVFLHSLVQGVASGVSPTEAKLAVYTPGDDIGLIEKQIDALLDRAFFLHFDGNRYRFSTEPSLVAVVNQEMSLVGKASAKKELDERIRRIWKKGVFAPEFFPAEPSDIDDSFERPTLAVIHYDAAATSSGDSAPPELVVHLFDRAGTAQGFRTFRNNLVFLVADSEAIDHAVDEARRYLAISRIVSDVQRFTQYTKDNQKRLKAIADEAELTLRVAITRMYRLLFYPDGAASEKHGRLSRALLPAQDQGDVDRDQTQIVLRSLRELGKVLTADDPDVAPAFVRQKAWPANADRVSPRQLQKEFASRIGLKILLDVNKLKETIRLGIRANQWLYYDPGKECAYSNESPTSPLVELTDDVELILPDAAQGVPICGKVTTAPPTETCPVCGNPQDQCTCAVPPGQVMEITGFGAPGQAFQQLVDTAQEKHIAKLSALEIRTEGAGAEFSRDLLAVALAVPQLPKAEIRVSMSGAFDIDDGSHLRVEYTGPWSRYREIHDVLQKAAKGVTNASGHLALGLTPPSPIEADGREIGDMRDTFTQLNPGKLSLRAVPANEEPS